MKLNTFYCFKRRLDTDPDSEGHRIRIPNGSGSKRLVFSWILFTRERLWHWEWRINNYFFFILVGWFTALICMLFSSPAPRNPHIFSNFFEKMMKIFKCTVKKISSLAYDLRWIIIMYWSINPVKIIWRQLKNSYEHFALFLLIKKL